jgi:hypothetical protein
VHQFVTRLTDAESLVMNEQVLFSSEAVKGLDEKLNIIVNNF